MLFTSTTISGDYEDGFIAVLSLKTGQWKTVQREGYFGRRCLISGATRCLSDVRAKQFFNFHALVYNPLTASQRTRVMGV